jgi:hypothetical protein
MERWRVRAMSLAPSSLARTAVMVSRDERSPPSRWSRERKRSVTAGARVPAHSYASMKGLAQSDSPIRSPLSDMLPQPIGAPTVVVPGSRQALALETGPAQATCTAMARGSQIPDRRRGGCKRCSQTIFSALPVNPNLGRSVLIR